MYYKAVRDAIDAHTKQTLPRKSGCNRAEGELDVFRLRRRLLVQQLQMSADEHTSAFPTEKDYSQLRSFTIQTERRSLLSWASSCSGRS